ncbi:MAG: hypothetical protein NWR72_12365 [Bacteroidia bacterium]|nr:hypothetical protein [Bacteroidia bacterium]
MKNNGYPAADFVGEPDDNPSFGEVNKELSTQRTGKGDAHSLAPVM